MKLLAISNFSKFASGEAHWHRSAIDQPFLPLGKGFTASPSL
jgi:hypothetical protein